MNQIHRKEVLALAISPLEESLSSEIPDVSNEVRVLARGTGLTIAAQLIGRLLHVFTEVIMARWLGPAVFGLYAIGWNLHRFLSIFANLGSGNGVIIFGVQYWKEDSPHFVGIFRAGFAVSVGMGVLIALASWFGAPWIAASIFNKPEAELAVRGAGLVLPFVMALGITGSLTRVTKRMQFDLIPDQVVFNIAKLLIFLVAFYLTNQEWAVWLAIGGAYFIAMLSVLYFANQLFPELRTTQPSPLSHSLKELLGYSIPTLLATAFSTTTLWLNRLIGGVLLPTDQVGIYQAASQFVNIFGVLLGSFVAVFVPIIAELYQSQEIEKLNALYKITTKWGFYIGLPIVVITLALPQQLMHVIYGNLYISGASLLIILTIAQLINIATGTVGPMFLMTKNQKFLVRFTIFSFLFNILSAVFLTPWFGALGLGIGMLLSSITINIGGLIWINRTLALWPYDRRYIKGLLAAGATLAVILLTGWLSGPEWFTFGLRSTLGLLAFIGTLLGLGLDEEDRSFLKELWRLFQNKLQAKT